MPRRHHLLLPFRRRPPLTLTSKMMTPLTPSHQAFPPPRTGGSTTASTCVAGAPKRAAASRCSTPRASSPGRKARATSKCRQPRGDTDDETGNPKRPAPGDPRPYKIQRELEHLMIDAEYLRANCIDLFHLGALGRLMRCVLSFRPSPSWK
jgi:hypothetical protein